MGGAAGSIGGSAGESGVEYRRAVAAYAVAHGLANAPLAGWGVPTVDGTVSAVALETDDPLDDVRVEFTSGLRSMVQAKRTLRLGRPFEDALNQWRKAAQAGLSRDRDRLVIVAAEMSAPIRNLQSALDLLRTDQPGSLTKGQADAIEYLERHLDGLSNTERLTLRHSAHIHRLDVEEEHFAQSREGALLLRLVVPSDSVSPAWSALLRIAGRLARIRGGYEIERWSSELRNEGILIQSDEDSFADPSNYKVVLHRVMTRLEAKPPRLFDPRFVWARDFRGDPWTIVSPLGGDARRDVVEDVTPVRLVPLALVPIWYLDRICLVLKEHKDWEYVLPSAEVGISSSRDYCANALSYALEVQAGLRVLVEPQFGAVAVSFKQSPTSRVPTCYVFPIFVFPRILHDRAAWADSDGTEFRLMSRSTLGALVDEKSPNSDVYRIVERLYSSGWARFRDHTTYPLSGISRRVRR